MINANPADMPLFTREVLKAIDALEQLTKAYDVEANFPSRGGGETTQNTTERPR